MSSAALLAGWTIKPLVEVATLQRGYDLPVQDRADGPFPIFAANGPVGFHATAKCKGPGVVTGRSGTIGKVHLVTDHYWPLNTSLYVTDFHGNDPKWVYYMLKNFGLERFSQGAGVPTLNRNLIHGEPVRVPPVCEQRRIAAILDKADALRTKRREALAQLDRLAQSIFVEMFGDAGSHKQKPLQDLCDLITDGTHQTPTYADEGVIFLSAKNVTSGEIDWEHIKYIPQSLHLELHRRLAPKVGDILLAKNGTTGVAAVVDRDCIFDVYVSLALLRPRSDVIPKYLLAAINSPACKKQFNGSLKGIGVPNLHLKEIRQALVPSPSIDEQRDFVRRIDALASLKASGRVALANAELLFNSLQHRAFQGEL